MEDLSLHVLDIVENSIEAGANHIQIKVVEDLKKDLLKIEIVDDGKGMDQNLSGKALDPFFTTKTVRKVGLGLSLFQEAVKTAGGDLVVQSQIGKGTRVTATFQHSHMDRKPLGDMARTMMTLIISHPGIQFAYVHRKNGRKYQFDTEKLRARSDLSLISIVELKKLIQKNWQDVR